MAKATAKKATSSASPKKANAKKAANNTSSPKKAAAGTANVQQANAKKAANRQAPPKKSTPAKNIKQSNLKKAPSKFSSPKKASPVNNLKQANAKKVANSNNSRSGVKSAAPKKAAKETMLEDLFLDSLKDIYWAEKALTKALPKMAKAATSEDLRDAFNEHLEVTNGQIQRLEQVFELIGEKAQAVKCEAMAGLTKEADEMTSETKKGTETRDVALIMAAQKVEHYEIATYGSLTTLAAQLGYDDAKELLGQTLQEEKDADTALTDLAESHINEEANDEDGNSNGDNTDNAASKKSGAKTKTKADSSDNLNDDNDDDEDDTNDKSDDDDNDNNKKGSGKVNDK